MNTYDHSCNVSKMEYWRDPVLPTKIEKGMTVAFVAPASAPEKDDLEFARALWEKVGYTVLFAPSAYSRGLYGGTPKEQAQELNAYLTDTRCDGVVAIRGGYGMMRYIDWLDYEGIRKAHKPFVGYSDCTALHCAVQRRSGLVTYHGPMAVDYKTFSHQDAQHMFALLEGKTKVIEPLPEPPRGQVAATGAWGTLYGGNLSLVAALCGTPYGLTVSMLEDNFLFLEDVGEPAYRIDRMLQQLRLQGIFRVVKGVILGTFAHCQWQEDDNNPSLVYDIGGQILSYMEECRADHEDAFVAYLPTGHGSPHWSIPLGSAVSFRLISNSVICAPYCATY